MNSSTDIVIGGIHPYFYRKSKFIKASIPYYNDDLTWCIKVAEEYPSYSRIFLMGTPTVFLIFVLVFGYFTSFLAYIFIQFDRKYAQRNNRDFHYIFFLVTLPTFFGTSQRFNPHHALLRFIYGYLSLCCIFYTQITLAHMFHFLKLEILHPQMNTIDALVENNFGLVGSRTVLHAI